MNSYKLLAHTETKLFLDSPVSTVKNDYTERSRSHATHITTYSDGCISIQFDWINKYTILLFITLLEIDEQD
jgi:hypothetical protein